MLENSTINTWSQRSTPQHTSLQHGPAQESATHPRMRLWAMDAWVPDSSILTDRVRLRAAMYEAATAGGLTVLGERFCDFENEAVTGVLVLAQSHLSLHTWPEYSLANIDLLSYGNTRGEGVLRAIEKKIGAVRTNIKCLSRGLE